MENQRARHKSSDSVTQLIKGLKRADEEAAAGLWRRYFEKLVRLARRKLNGAPRRMADEEDIALSVLKSVCLRAGRGEFNWLADRDGLWRILVTITSRKAFESQRHERRLKRRATKCSLPVEFVPSGEPSPAMLAAMNDERARLLALLPDDTCRDIARWKMEGETDAAIASRLDVVDRTVRRKTQLIRAIWEEELSRRRAER